MADLTPESIRAGIANAEASIAASEASIRAQRAVIADFEAAQRAYALLNPPFMSVGMERRNGVGHTPPASAENPHRPMTNKWFLWQALNESSSVWATANEAQAIATRLKGEEIPMSSVSPMLSEMARSDKTILRDGLKVSLPHRSQGLPTAHVPLTGMFALTKEGDEDL